MAEMLAARLFNPHKGRELPFVYGVVTTGSVWKFLRLDGNAVSIDIREYPISESGRIVGALVSMPRSKDNPPGPSSEWRMMGYKSIDFKANPYNNYAASLFG